MHIRATGYINVTKIGVIGDRRRSVAISNISAVSVILIFRSGSSTGSLYIKIIRIFIESSLAMVSVAVLKPTALGLKVILNVVLPLGAN